MSQLVLQMEDNQIYSSREEGMSKVFNLPYFIELFQIYMHVKI